MEITQNICILDLFSKIQSFIFLKKDTVIFNIFFQKKVLFLSFILRIQSARNHCNPKCHFNSNFEKV